MTGGKEPEVELSYGETFTYLGLHGEDFSGVERELMLEESAKAPVKAGDQLGTLRYRFNGERQAHGERAPRVPPVGLQPSGPESVTPPVERLRSTPSMA